MNPRKYSFPKPNDLKNLFRNLFERRISEVLVILLISVALSFGYNFLTIIRDIGNAFTSNENTALKAIINASSFNFFLCFSTLLLLSFFGGLWKFITAALFFLSTISFYIQSKFGIIFDETMLINALDSIGHTADAIEATFFSYFLVLFAIPTILLFCLVLQKTNLKKKIAILTFSLLVNIFFIIFTSKQQQRFVFETLSPINYLGSIERYLSRFHHNRQIAKNRSELNKIFEFSNKNLPKNLNLVIVIGESLRADHMEINGYKRQTTPHLAMILKTKNMLNFRSQASFNTTSPSVTSLLSHRLDSEFLEIPPEKSLVNLAKNLGFKTHWFSTQSSKEFGNGMLNIMAMEADEYFFRDHLATSESHHKIYDEALISSLKSAIQKPGRNFIVLHSFGSHIRYFDRYPKNFRIFLPECTSSTSSCKQNALVNAYDNSVLYTDHFLNETIKSLDNTSSIMFFISDHGNYLGENGQFANGNPSKKPSIEQVVPFMIYGSMKFLKNEELKKRFIAAGKRQNQMLNPDYFFDSVLGCIGVESKLIDGRNFNLCALKKKITRRTIK